MHRPADQDLGYRRDTAMTLRPQTDAVGEQHRRSTNAAMKETKCKCAGLFRKHAKVIAEGGGAITLTHYARPETFSVG
jgi:hypothetical protein